MSFPFLSFFKEKTLFLVADEGDVELKTYLEENWNDINLKIERLGSQLIYYPILQKKGLVLSKSSLQFIRYETPVFYSLYDDEIQNSIQKILEVISPEEFYESIFGDLDFGSNERPFIAYYKSKTSSGDENKFEFLATGSKTIEFLDYLQDLFGFRGVEHSVDAISFEGAASFDHAISPEEEEGDVFYSRRSASISPKESLSFKSFFPKKYDADKSFEEESLEDAAELIEMVTAMKEDGKIGGIALTLLHILNTLEKDNPDILERVKEVIGKARLQEGKYVLSPICIDRHYNIFLTDYGNQEVKMSTLPKALYLLFLRYPEGIRFKELYTYKNELYEIYSRITNRSDLSEIRKSIDNLVDMSQPDINQKCSRIRQAFRKIMDEHIAKHYYITGGRGKPKKISLPPELIDIRS